MPHVGEEEGGGGNGEFSQAFVGGVSGEKEAGVSDGREGRAGMVDGVQESCDISRQNVHDVGV